MNITIFRIIIVFTSISFFAFIFYIIRYAMKQKRMRNKALGKLGSSPNGTGIFESTEYRYCYYPGSKNSPSYFKVEIDASSDGSFKIARESGFDRLFKRLGISTEIQTGDTNFDDSFYITADNEEFTKAVFSSTERRQAVRNIIDRF